MIDLDDVMSDMDEMEARDSGRPARTESEEVDDIFSDDTGKETGSDAEAGEPPILDVKGKTLVGTVEHYYERLDVVAVKLVGALKVGDAIAINGGEGETREIVSSMQIDRKDVEEASAGDSVGIKVTNPAPAGSRVYRL